MKDIGKKRSSIFIGNATVVRDLELVSQEDLGRQDYRRFGAVTYCTCSVEA